MASTRVHTVRRSLLPSVALVLVAGALTAAPVVAAPAPQGAGANGADVVRLTPDQRGVTRAASVPLAGAGTAADKASPGAMNLRTGSVLQTKRLDTATYRMVAVTWTHGDPDVEVRYRDSDGWSKWTHLETLTDGPTRAEAAAATRRGTELLWVNRADGVQVRSTAATGLRLELIDPGKLASDRPVTRRTTAPQVAARSLTTKKTQKRQPKVAPRPTLNSRKKWKANPDWRNGTPRYLHKIKSVHVHHTASGNDYAKADVPGILRGMYRYHTKTLGWFDIGYNFLVDKWGRAWVGRSGGANKRVRGAHTLGFNHASVGIAAIGNFESRTPPKALVDMVIRLAAWKLDHDGQPATGKVALKSQGSDRYPSGKRVRLPRIDGHRDTNQTACPGQLLYNQLPSIRKRTQKRIDRYS